MVGIYQCAGFDIILITKNCIFTLYTHRDIFYSQLYSDISPNASIPLEECAPNRFPKLIHWLLDQLPPTQETLSKYETFLL